MSPAPAKSGPTMWISFIRAGSTKLYLNVIPADTGERQSAYTHIPSAPIAAEMAIMVK